MTAHRPMHLSPGCEAGCNDERYMKALNALMLKATDPQWTTQTICLPICRVHDGYIPNQRCDHTSGRLHVDRCPC